MDYVDSINSPVGEITLASDGEALVGLWLEGQKHFASTVGETQRKPDLPVFAQARTWLSRYFEGEDPGALPPLHLRGTEFRQLVWKHLAEIPYGTLTTYGELARRIEAETGCRASARAVGSAVGRNPLSVMVPCHRVVGSNGSLTGYAGGVDKKIALLRLEGIDVDEAAGRIRQK